MSRSTFIEPILLAKHLPTVVGIIAGLLITILILREAGRHK
jgi:hypothetical protein